MNINSIRIPEIFSYKECLKFLSRSAHECLFLVENESIRKVFHFDRKPILIEITQENQGALKIGYLNETPDAHQRKSYQKLYCQNGWTLTMI